MRDWMSGRRDRSRSRRRHRGARGGGPLRYLDTIVLLAVPLTLRHLLLSQGIRLSQGQGQRRGSLSRVLGAGCGFQIDLTFEIQGLLRTKPGVRGLKIRGLVILALSAKEGGDCLRCKWWTFCSTSERWMATKWKD